MPLRRVRNKLPGMGGDLNFCQAMPLRSVDRMIKNLNTVL
jgi:hypothetical protein